ncbi:fibrous sheath CABYR-binding protein [Trachinotus anak]|uniref:fibrous sheath CABYR-binding protein n=1 Tax=Trachinotus anak TaxID=443729 RepID=UPI0039F22206
MSKDVDRSQVFKTTRVRTALKNDGSWIQKSKEEKGEQDEARTAPAVERRPAPVRQNSYVLFTAKKFELVDPPLSSPLQETQLSSSEGDSANQANGDVIPLQKNAQPEGSTVAATDDTKPQAPTEELIQNGEAQLQKIVANTAAENKEEYADTPVDQSNVEPSKRAAEVSADVHVAEHIQHGEAQTVYQAVSPVEPAEQPVANTTAENKGEYTDTVAEQSNVEHSEVRVSAVVEVKPQEEPSVETDLENAAHLEDVGVESAEPPAEKSCNKGPPEHSAEEIVKAEAVVEPLPEASDVVRATLVVLKNSQEADPDLLVESASESPIYCATEAATEGSCERCPPEKSTAEIVEVVAEVVVEASPETPAVSKATPRDEAALQSTGEPILDFVSESPIHSAAETADKSVEPKVESAAPTEPALKARAGEVVEGEVQPVNNVVVERSAEPAPENSADRVMELSIEDALEPADKVCDGAIELTDALDVPPSTAEAVPEPVEDPKQTHSEDSKVNHSDDTNITEMFQKPREELPSTHTLKQTSDGKAVCSFCDQVIDGNIKITLSEPVVICHPDCLKCGVCAKILGDLLTPMFLHDQVIHCGGCFAKALKA